jgi:2-hydroxy-3-keto-5-methylthiopentenyl-1-phosphate phosphatase
MNKRIPLYLDTSAPGWMVQSDFDGTISLLDVTDTLLTRFGKPGWQELRTPGSAARSARANA